MLFEIHDIILHRMMLRSHKWYRNAVKKMCRRSDYSSSAFDQWYCNRMYQVHSFFKRAYMNHVRRPKKGHMLFLTTMDEVFSQAATLRVLWPKLPLKVGIKHA